MESQHPALRPISPNDCALAIALPLTRAQFLADLEVPDEKDFARHFCITKGLERALPEFRWQAYAQEVLLVQAVCEKAKAADVTVCDGARLADLTELLRRFPAVSLVTHARFVPITPADILDAAWLWTRLRAPENDREAAMRRAVAQQDATLLQDDSAHLHPTELGQRLADAIGAIAAEAERCYWNEATGRRRVVEQLTDGWQGTLTRCEFELAFPDCLAAARTLEFHDRLHTVPELKAAVPTTFDGVLDLTVCNSVIPAAAIRRARPDCLVVANRRPAHLHSRMYLYGLAIDLLRQQPQPFIEALKRVRTEQEQFQVKEKTRWKLFGKFFSSIPRL